MTDGERWARDELERLRSRHFSPAAVTAFLLASGHRAADARAARPDLARRARRWELAGLAAWALAAAAGRQPFRRRLGPGLAWWGATCVMLDWHLGMFESEDGRPCNLGAADALTLTRAWLVPVIADGMSPAALGVAADDRLPLDGHGCAHHQSHARGARPRRAGGRSGAGGRAAGGGSPAAAAPAGDRARARSTDGGGGVLERRVLHPREAAVGRDPAGGALDHAGACRRAHGRGGRPPAPGRSAGGQRLGCEPGAVGRRDLERPAGLMLDAYARGLYRPGAVDRLAEHATPPWHRGARGDRGGPGRGRGLLRPRWRWGRWPLALALMAGQPRP
ncbi:MAG: hypothetical protein WKF40_01985 [Thermoleophilaceae bacterium]